MEKIKLSNIDETIIHDTCDNGLEIYLHQNKNVNSFYITLNIRYGSVDTEFKYKGRKNSITVPDGIAHFLEHVNFNEPNGKSAHEFFNDLGSDINAFTTFDYTAYLVYATNKFKKNLDHLLDYVFVPHFTKKNVKGEQDIIAEEISMYSDYPDQVFTYKASENLYQKDKTRINILGDTSSIREITPEHLTLVHNLFYHPKNAFVVITGNFDIEEAITIIKENMAAKKFPKWKEPVKVLEKEPIAVVKEYDEIKQNIETPKLELAYKISRKNFQDIDDIDLSAYLNAILKQNFGRTSDFNENLLSSRQIKAGFGYSIKVNNDIVVITIECETDYPKEIIKKIKSQMKKLKLDEVELERYKKISIANNVMAYDNIEVVNGIIEDDLINHSLVVNNYYDRINNLHMKKGREILKALNVDNYSVLVAYPKLKSNA